MKNEPIVTVSMAAKLCRITFEHAWHLCQTGQWRTVTIHERITRVPMTEVDAWNSGPGSTAAVREWRREQKSCAR